MRQINRVTGRERRVRIRDYIVRPTNDSFAEPDAESEPSTPTALLEFAAKMNRNSRGSFRIEHDTLRELGFML